MYGSMPTLFLIRPLLIPLPTMNIKIQEQSNRRIFTAFNLVFRNQPEEFILQGI